MALLFSLIFDWYTNQPSQIIFEAAAWGYVLHFFELLYSAQGNAGDK